MGRDDNPLTVRMKDYEKTWCDLRADSDLPHIIRVDGKNFSTFTKSFATFDDIIHDGMIQAAKDLLVAFPSATVAYTHSDEITIVFPTGAINTCYDGKILKLVSISGAVATRGFNDGIRRVAGDIPGAVFDSRIVPLPSNEEIANNLLFRARDNIRNAKMGFAQMYYSAKELHGIPADVAIAKVASEKGITWESLPGWVKYGDFIKRTLVPHEGFNPATGLTESTVRTIMSVQNIPFAFSPEFVEILLAKLI